MEDTQQPNPSVHPIHPAIAASRVRPSLATPANRKANRAGVRRAASQQKGTGCYKPPATAISGATLSLIYFQSYYEAEDQGASAGVYAAKLVTAVARVGLFRVIVVVDVLMANDAREFHERQLFVGQQLHGAQLGHVLDQSVALLQSLRVVVDAPD